MAKTNRAITITPVKQSTLPVAGFLSALNPVGTIATAISDILHYRLEVKRIEAQREAVAYQAGVAHRQISATLRTKLAKLETERGLIVMRLKLASQSLANLHVERMRIIQCVENCTAVLRESAHPLESKQLALEAISQFSALLQGHIMNERITLDGLSRDVLKQFEPPPVNRTNRQLA
jgi:hypothetical protein